MATTNAKAAVTNSKAAVAKKLWPYEQPDFAAIKKQKITLPETFQVGDFIALEGGTGGNRVVKVLSTTPAGSTGNGIIETEVVWHSNPYNVGKKLASQWISIRSNGGRLVHPVEIKLPPLPPPVPTPPQRPIPGFAVADAGKAASPGTLAALSAIHQAIECVGKQTWFNQGEQADKLEELIQLQTDGNELLRETNTLLAKLVEAWGGAK